MRLPAARDYGSARACSKHVGMSSSPNGSIIETDSPARRDRLPGSRFHLAVAAAPGITLANRPNIEMMSRRDKNPS
jgi:hypothetical protein